MSGHPGLIDQASGRVAATVPSSARLYDYYLGGKDNYACDRAAAEKIRAVFPGLAGAARANRAFHRRAAAWIAGRGVAQFIDVGCGLPTVGNTHQVVPPWRQGSPPSGVSSAHSSGSIASR